MSAPAAARRRPSLRLRLLLIAIGLGVPLVAAELTLHAFPRLLPAWFRERYPHHGVEFLRPGVFDTTSIDDVPLPYPVDPYAGPPPHDLVDLGVAPPEAAQADAAATPHMTMPADRDGLPNASELAAADIVLVGDSFLVYGSQQEPPGLQRTLAERLGARVKNLGISGLGPVHERGLLEQRGLPAKPRLVLWFFFGGNDVLDASFSAIWKAQGTDTLAKLFADRRPPALWLPALAAALLESTPKSPMLPAPVPAMPSTRGAFRGWFHPDYLRLCAIDRAAVAGSAGFVVATQIVKQASVRCAELGARFLLVFVPSKEQVHIGHVALDADVLARCVAASNFPVLAVPSDPVALQAAVLTNRTAVEAALQSFCAANDVPFWSATPPLEALAQAGDSGYHQADTHWRAEGQRAVAEALAAVLRERGLFTR